MSIKQAFGWMACVAAALVLTVSAQAIVIADGDNFTVEAMNVRGVGDGSESLVAFDLMISSKTGNPAVAIDGSIGGNLHHEQFASPFPPFAINASPTPQTSGESAIDSHFLFNAGQLLSVSEPNEPAIDPTSSNEPGLLGGQTGIGGPLAGTFSLNPQQVTLTDPLALAQIVVPVEASLWAEGPLDLAIGEGQDVILDMALADGDVSQPANTSFSFVPEPANNRINIPQL